MSDTTTRKPRRWVKVLAWTGGVLGVLVLGIAGAGFYFLYAPATPEPAGWDRDGVDDGRLDAAFFGC